MKSVEPKHLKVRPFWKVKFILTLCYILGIALPNSRRTLYKSVYFVVLIISLCAHIYTMLEKTKSTDYNYIIKLTDQITNFFLFVTCSVISIRNIFVRPKRVRKFLKKLKMFDEKVMLHQSIETTLFWICVLSAHATVILTLSVDCYEWLSTVGMTKYKHYIFRNINYYKLFVTQFLIFWVTIEMGSRFNFLNKLLEKQFSSKPNSAVFYTVKRNFFGTMMQQSTLLKDVRTISSLHNELCNIIEQFNEVFGIFILFCILFTIMGGVQYTATFIFSSILFNRNDHVNFAVQFRIIGCFWVFNSFVSIAFH